MKRKFVNLLSIAILILSEVLISVSLYVEIKSERKSAIAYATIEASSSLNRDILYRTWASMHGGVYVPVTDDVQPNPYLKVPERDITINGNPFTLVNPAYMNRQVYELSSTSNGIKGHITSLNPIRPQNKADAWEEHALKQFDSEIVELSNVEKMDNEDYLRLMRPFFVENSCLKCHAEQGYKVGDVRGGISVSVPMKQYYDVSKDNTMIAWVSHAFTFFIFLVVFTLLYLFNNKLYRNGELLQKKLAHQNNKLTNKNEELEVARVGAEKADKLKSAFLANMSHEIRTPMNGILGFTELLQDANLSVENQKNYLGIIQKSSDRLLNTVNDIIEISKIESEEATILLSEVDIIQHLESLVIFFKPEAEKKGLNLVNESFSGGFESLIMTDATKLNSILNNLIKNAIKYTEKGYIKVGLKQKDGQLLFYCIDSGIGIPQDRTEAIFNRFEQADVADKQVQQGSGLGLAIVKSYVEMMDGKIWMESEEGKGSVFYVSLPYNPVGSKEQQIAEKEKMVDSKKKNINVLIVEDDEVSSMYLSVIINQIVKNVRCVHNGIEAVDTCKNNPSIDLVLMDLKMPKMDGMEATRRIREFNKDVIIVAQTAFSFEEDKEKALKAGCTDFISKPIKKDKVVEVINKYFTKC